MGANKRKQITVAVMGPHTSGASCYIKALKANSESYNGKYETTFVPAVSSVKNNKIKIIDLPEDVSYAPSITSSYLQGAERLLLVFDVSVAVSKIGQWLEKKKAAIEKAYGFDKPILVLLNKYDVAEHIPIQQIDDMLAKAFPQCQIKLMCCSVRTGFGIALAHKELISMALSVDKSVLGVKKKQPKMKYAMSRTDCINSFSIRLQEHQKKLFAEQQKQVCTWWYRWFTRDNKAIKLACIKLLLDKLAEKRPEVAKCEIPLDLMVVINQARQQLGQKKWHMANAGLFSTRLATNIKQAQQEWQHKSPIDIVLPLEAPF